MPTVGARSVNESGTSSGPNSGDDVGMRIVQKVAAALERDPMDLEPLAGIVDVDALSSLASTQSVDVSFEYEGLQVSVRTDGTVDVERFERRTP